ncbi:MAG: T9SS type A sorting domain-containing protein [bacterium]
MNINKNHKSIDSYFESARKQKTPVSRDKAASLLEKDGLLNTYPQSFFSKKGVKAMTIASSIIIVAMIGSIGSGIFNNSTYKQKHEIEPVDVKSEIVNNEQTKQNSEEQDISSNKTDSQKPMEIESLKDNFIRGMNTITLSDEELKEFGIFYDTYKDDDIIFQCIKFALERNDKTYHEFIFFRDNCPKMVFIQGDFDSSKKFLKIEPIQVSDRAEGGNGYYNGKYNGDDKDLNSFIKYQKTLFDLYDISFRADTDFSNIPQNVLDCVSDLNQLFEIYNPGSKETMWKEEPIQNNLTTISDYFKKIKKSEKETKHIDTIKIYTVGRDSLVYSIITDDVNNPEHHKTIKKMLKDKQGMTFVIDWPSRVEFYKILANMNKVVEQKLSEIKNLIERYLRINNMIALHVPFKNDAQNGVTFWFQPSIELINALPKRYRKDLSYEFKLFDSNEPYCGAPIDLEKAYLDVWRTCSGAIENLRVFPNPVKDILNVKFELKENRDITFSIYDLSGRKIKDVSKSEQYSSGTISHSLYLSDLQKGMYYIVASSKNNEQVMQRFIKE